jgi:arsenate reductase
MLLGEGVSRGRILPRHGGEVTARNAFQEVLHIPTAMAAHADHAQPDAAGNPAHARLNASFPAAPHRSRLRLTTRLIHCYTYPKRGPIFMEKLTVYQKPTCSTCRQALALLREAKAKFVTIDYFATPLSTATLRRLIQKLGITPRQLLRTNEDAYKKLQLDEQEPSDEELIRLMVLYPELIQRPIIEKGDKAVLGRPPENVKALL